MKNSLALGLSLALVAISGTTFAQGVQKTNPHKDGPKVASKSHLGARNVSLPGALAASVGGSDDCSAPMPISGQGTFPYDNSAATNGAEGQNEYLCYDFGSSAVDNDVWFAWTADVTGTAVVNTCGFTTLDTKIAAYPDNGGGCPAPGSVLDCNDDFCSLESQVSFACNNASTYLLQIGNFPGASGGTGSIGVTINTPITNDECAAATAIAGQGSFPYTNVGSSTSAEGQTETICYQFGSSAVVNDVWFLWTADATGTGIIDLCGADHDTKLAVYPSSGSSCPAGGSVLACNDDSCGLQSAVQVAVTAGVDYIVQVGSYPGSASFGSGNINVSILSGGPSNDDCSAPTAIAGQGNFPYDGTLATTGAEGQTELACDTHNNYGTGVTNDIWYDWTADATGYVTVSNLGNTSVDSKIAAYAGGGCPTAGSAIICNDDNNATFQSMIQFAVVSGNVYSLQIGTWPTGTGTGVANGTGSMDISINTAAAAGDNCDNAIAISGAGSFTADTSTATTGSFGQEENLCSKFGNNEFSNDLWYEWTATSTGDTHVLTCNTGSGDSKLGAYPGGSCPLPQTSIACLDDSCGLLTEITFPAVSGQTYLIQVGNYFPATAGTFVLDIYTDSTLSATSFCSGDGSGTPCPCGNTGNAGHGCANGADPTGAQLAASGSGSILSADTVLSASGLVGSQPGLYFQGNNAISSGAGVAFGDGLRCAGGGVIRLQVRFAGGGGASETSIDIASKGGVVAGDVKRYQLWYRDPNTSLCGAQFNLSNGMEIIWSA